MAITESNIVTAVRKNLDEIEANGASFSSGTDDADLDIIIKLHIKPAVLFILKNASEDNLLGCTKTANLTSGSATLSNALRVLWAKGTNTRAVKDFVPDYSPEYTRLESSNAHVKPTSTRPAASLSGIGTSSIVVKFYGATTGSVAYVAVPTYSSSDVGLDGSLESALIYYVTGLTLLSLHEDQHGEAMMQQAIAMIGAVSKSDN